VTLTRAGERKNSPPPPYIINKVLENNGLKFKINISSFKADSKHKLTKSLAYFGLKKSDFFRYSHS